MHAFISGGELFVRNADGKVRSIESAFIKEKSEQAQNSKSLHAWKNRDHAAGPFSGESVWGKQGTAIHGPMFRFKSVFPAGDDKLYYSMSNHEVTGLFHYDLNEDHEQRLFHKTNFHEFGLDFSTKRKEFLAAVLGKNGQVDLELLDNNGKRLKPITGGDSQDTNPSFSRKNPNEVLFQSRGVGRSEEGMIIGFSPEYVQRLNLETGAMEDLLNDTRFDYLLPKEDADGNVYCIRRPHGVEERPSIINTLTYVVLFPFHLLKAILNFLQVFTSIFSQGPPQKAGMPRQTQELEQYVTVLGKTISLAKVYKARNNDDDRGIVPRSWELIRIKPDKNVDVLANCVSCYDLDDNGNIYYTNGFRVHEFGGASKAIFKHNVIECLRSLSEKA